MGTFVSVIARKLKNPWEPASNACAILVENKVHEGLDNDWAEAALTISTNATLCAQYEATGSDFCKLPETFRESFSRSCDPPATFLNIIGSFLLGISVFLLCTIVFVLVLALLLLAGMFFVDLFENLQQCFSKKKTWAEFELKRMRHLSRGCVGSIEDIER
ncbi:hypothetical protein JX265_011450 [Neoarthrinium moseri]|uniref:Uncharacterized protein n=1 Tax=Neoarthrinium moseri TaxID=1658444 RepID=A0A9P9WCL3_9PEZI|nr:hypothetical protein JX265_011450 [Neoarthrinium moseri]